MEQITLNKQDLDKIKNVVDEFDVQNFDVIKDENCGGIGYTLDITFWTDFKGHRGQVIIPLITALDW